MIKLKEYQKAGTTLTFLPLIPYYLLNKHNHPSIAKYLLISCLVLALVCFANKKTGKNIYLYGEKLGQAIGQILSSIALFFIYYLAVLPTGLLMKICKRDRLKLKKTAETTYWTDLNTEDNYENQF